MAYPVPHTVGWLIINCPESGTGCALFWFILPAMNSSEPRQIENDSRHPVVEPLPNGSKSPRRTCKMLSRTFVWVADGSTLEQVGLRATVVLYCIRPDLISGQSLEETGLLLSSTGYPPPRFENSTAYLASRVKKFESDPRMIVSAASQAQRSADFVLGI